MANLKTLIALAVSVLIPFGAYAAEDESASCTHMEGGKGAVVQAVKGGTIHTSEVRLNRKRTAKTFHTQAHITLKHVFPSTATCYTWDVELVLPQCWSLNATSNNDFKSSLSLTGLQKTETARWSLTNTEVNDNEIADRKCHMEEDFGAWRTYKAHFKVTVWNNEDEAPRRVQPPEGGFHYYFPLTLGID